MSYPCLNLAHTHTLLFWYYSMLLSFGFIWIECTGVNPFQFGLQKICHGESTCFSNFSHCIGLLCHLQYVMLYSGIDWRRCMCLPTMHFFALICCVFWYPSSTWGIILTVKNNAFVWMWNIYIFKILIEFCLITSVNSSQLAKMNK